MKVYVITMGEYSDKYNYGVTLDRAKAERFVERFNAENKWADANVEEHDMDAWDDERLVFSVVVKRGKTLAEAIDKEGRDINDVRPYIEFFRTGPNLFDFKEVQTGYSVYVKAKDKEHAIKIAFDLIAEYKAREAGIC